MCVDIVIVIRGTSVYSLSQVCVIVCIAERDTFVCLHAYILYRSASFFCVCVCVSVFFHVSMWRLMVPGLDGGVSAPEGSAEICLCVGSKGRGGGLLPRRPASLPARQLQSLMPPPHPCQDAPLPLSYFFLPVLRLGKE